MKIPPSNKTSSPFRAPQESFHAVPWVGRNPPAKILAIRLQAFGDTIITLPYLQALRNNLPTTSFHFLTRAESGDLPRNLTMFDHVHTLDGGRNAVRQWKAAAFLVPRLRAEHYDVVIDLQRNHLSRSLRQMLHPKSFSEFDRFSLKSAGERTASTIETLRLPPLKYGPAELLLRDENRGLDQLHSAGYDPAKKLIVLNPAGSFVTRNWPIENYYQFASGWMKNVDARVQFLMLGLDAVREKAMYLQEKLGAHFLNLVGKTSVSGAFNILRKVSLVLSEDSGLMHMAWVARVPVVALFGSTKSVWSKPLGDRSVCLDSSDLQCGECLQPECQFGDVRCLTRYESFHVIDVAKKLLEKGIQRGS